MTALRPIPAGVRAGVFPDLQPQRQDASFPNWLDFLRDNVPGLAMNHVENPQCLAASQQQRSGGG